MPSKMESSVLELVRPEETTSLLRDLVRIDSSDGNTSVVEMLCALLEHEGIEYELDQVQPEHTNLLVRLGKKAPAARLLYSCHLDTVPVGATHAWVNDPLEGAVEQERLYGRGASDDKGGVAAMVMAAVGLRRSGLDFRSQLLLTCVAAETLGNLGTRHLANNGLAADFAVVGEYSEGDKLATAYRGALWGRIHVRGKTSHTGRPQLGADAIGAALDHVIPSLRSHDLSAVDHPLLPPAKLTITQMSGGHTRTSIADGCDITVDVRLLPGQRHTEIWQDLCGVVEAASAKCPGIDCEMELLYGVDGFETPKSVADVGVLSQCIEEVTGQSPSELGKVGMCDGNVLANDLAIPTVIYGPGNPSGMGTNEYCDLKALETCRRVYTILALRLLEIDTDRTKIEKELA